MAAAGAFYIQVTLMAALSGGSSRACCAEAHRSGSRTTNTAAFQSRKWRLQTTADAILATRHKRSGHPFEWVFHVGGIVSPTFVFNCPLHRGRTVNYTTLQKAWQGRTKLSAAR